jgi:hypothetical protein
MHSQQQKSKNGSQRPENENLPNVSREISTLSNFDLLNTFATEGNILIRRPF